MKRSFAGLYIAVALLACSSSLAQETWVARSSGVTVPLWSVAYGGGQWVACGEQGTILTSLDGATWTKRASGFPTRWLVGVGYGAGTWVVVGEAGLILTSSDGVGWVPRNSTGTRVNAVGYANGLFLAVDDAGDRWVSPNGVDWSFGQTSRGGWLRGLTYGANSFVVTGISGIQTTPDGNVFTARVVDNAIYIDGAAYGRGLFLATGTSGMTYRSSDGFTWTLLPPTTSARLLGAAFFNNGFVAVGTEGAIVTSPDGSQWTSRVSGTDQLLLAVGAGPTSVIAVGFGGVIRESIAPPGAPAIVTQPSPVTDGVGGNVTFTVTASGSAPLTYQWSRNGADLGGATNATLALRNVQPIDTGSYAVVVRNNAGSVTSNAVALTLTATAIAPRISSQPVDQAVGTGATAIFTVGVSGTAPLGYQWRFNGAAIPGGMGSSLIIPNVGSANAGAYTVLVTNTAGSVTSSAVTLIVRQPPLIIAPPVDQSAAIGSNVVFSVSATGATPLNYQWLKDGREIAGATNAILSLASVTNNDAGGYAVTVRNTVGGVTSRAVTLIVSAAASRLANLSVRTLAGAGSQTLIVGFVVSGESGTKPVLLRGVGPSLSAFGVTGVLADPQLTLFRGGIQVAVNDNWGDSSAVDQIAQVARNVGAFTLDPRSRDAALYSGLPPGGYTTQVTSPGVAGVALVELYEADASPQSRLVNVSARSLAGTGADILIAGFVVQGNAPKTLLVRGVGPTLAAFGMTDALLDPQLVILRGTDVVATNDDWWRNDGAQSLPPVFGLVGAFALAPQSRDAALVVALPPGQYTAQISGAGGTTGVALVEVYEVP